MQTLSGSSCLNAAQIPPLYTRDTHYVIISRIQPNQSLPAFNDQIWRFSTLKEVHYLWINWARMDGFHSSNWMIVSSSWISRCVQTLTFAFSHSDEHGSSELGLSFCCSALVLLHVLCSKHFLLYVLTLTVSEYVCTMSNKAICSCFICYIYQL